MVNYWIRINGARFQTCHGVLDHEKTVPQEFLVDMALRTNFMRATVSDGLQDTINYARLLEIITGVMMGPAHNLLESLAGEIMNQIAEENGDRVQSLSVKVTKSAPPLAGIVQSVEVEMNYDS